MGKKRKEKELNPSGRRLGHGRTALEGTVDSAGPLSFLIFDSRCKLFPLQRPQDTHPFNSEMEPKDS